jgi:hypothetical protein
MESARKGMCKKSKQTTLTSSTQYIRIFAHDGRVMYQFMCDKVELQAKAMKDKGRAGEKRPVNDIFIFFANKCKIVVAAANEKKKYFSYFASKK